MSPFSWPWKRSTGSTDLLDRQPDIGQPPTKTWLWAVKPEYYLESDGTERRDLDPAAGYSPGGWWTCNRETRAGDQAMIYRTSPRMDIAFLARAESDAYPLSSRDAPTGKPSYACDYRIVAKLDPPVSLQEIRSNPALRTWGALKRNFQGAVHEVPPDVWSQLTQRSSTTRGTLDKDVAQGAIEFQLEREIEDALSADPSAFVKFGHDLQLVGRQQPCSLGGRSDLLFRDTATKRMVVVELKRQKVGRDAVAQVLSYMASIQQDDPKGRRPLGILVGASMDAQAAGIVRGQPDVSFIGLAELGFRRLGT